MREMKDSGVAWIGEIPRDWKIIANKHLMKKVKNIRTKYMGEDVLSLTMRGVIVRDLDNPSGKMPASFDGYQFVEAGNLLMCLFDIDVTPRCIGFIKNDGVCSPAYSQFKLSEQADTGFYYYYYLNLDHTKELLHLAKNLRHSLTEEQLGAVPTALPPIEEQRKIVIFLDDKLAQVDTLIANVQAQIEKLKAYKQSVITEVVTKGLDPTVPMKDSGVEWIGEIPEHWDVAKLRTRTKMLTPMRDKPEDLNGPIPWVRIEDYCGKYITASKEQLGVSTETVAAMNLKIYPVGTVLCTSSCDLGKCAIVAKELVSNQRFIGIIPQPNLSSDYLYYLMLSNAERLNTLSTGSIQANLSRVSFEQLLVQFPPMEEQEALSDYLDKKCEAADHLIALKQSKIEKLEQYKKSLIYEYVTGKKEVS